MFILFLVLDYARSFKTTIVLICCEVMGIDKTLNNYEPIGITHIKKTSPKRKQKSKQRKMIEVTSLGQMFKRGIWANIQKRL